MKESKLSPFDGDLLAMIAHKVSDKTIKPLKMEIPRK